LALPQDGLPQAAGPLETLSPRGSYKDRGLGRGIVLENDLIASGDDGERRRTEEGEA
jgi:hypothetical protein